MVGAVRVPRTVEKQFRFTTGATVSSGSAATAQCCRRFAGRPKSYSHATSAGEAPAALFSYFNVRFSV